MGWESFDVIRFDLGPLLQGQTRIAKLKSAYNLLIISLRGLQCETNLYDIMGWESPDVFRFDLEPLLQGQTRRVKLVVIATFHTDIVTHTSNTFYYATIAYHVGLNAVLGLPHPGPTS